MTHAHIQMLDTSFAREVADGIHIGRKFVFLDFDRLSDAEASVSALWQTGKELHPDFGTRSSGQMTIPLLTNHPVRLPGMEIRSADTPVLRLLSITSDRALYRHSHDTVELLVLDLSPSGQANRFGQERLIDVFCEGTRIDQHSVLLDEHGVGQVRLFDLPIGNYAVTLAGASDSQQCKFQVAGFQLAPLNATLTRSNLKGSQFSTMLHLDRFGVDFDGLVRIGLYDLNQRIDSRTVTARNGIAYATFEMTGDGPHHLDVSLSSHADATATIPLLGSKKTERTPTILSASGPVYEASLMPTQGANLTRGLHILSNQIEMSPLRVHSVDGTHARLEAVANIDDVCVIVSNFGNADDGMESTPEKVLRWQRLKAGESVEVELSEVCGLLSAAGFVDGAPWESLSVTIQPSRMQTQVSVRNFGNPGECISPGSRVVIEVDTSNQEPGGVVQVIVKDARLQANDRPQQRLANCIKRVAAEVESGVQSVVNANVAIRQFAVSRQAAYCGGPDLIDDEVLSMLVRKGVVSQEQADEVKQVAFETHASFESYLYFTGYANPETVTRAIAEHYRIEFFDLRSTAIDDLIIELIPESVARENGVIPVSVRDGTLVMAASNPFDLELNEKLRFILNRAVHFGISPNNQVFDAINHYYGLIEGESVDSMLQEFTDTAIDFTETEEIEYQDDAGPAFNLTTLGVLLDDNLSSESVESELNALSTDAQQAGGFLSTISCQLVPIESGLASIVVDLPDAPSRYTVDVFAVRAGHWSQSQTQFESEQDPFVHLELPDQICGDDKAVGRVVARCKSGRMTLTVLCAGQSVDLFDSKTGQPVSTDEMLEESMVEFTFVASFGKYVAEVRDEDSQNTVQHSREVSEMGALVQRRRVLHMLRPGETIRCDQSIQRIRLLPSPKPIARMVAQATADYEHLCCEQTAAKLFAAFASCAQSQVGPVELQKSMQAIRSGIERMESMWSESHGFAFYPCQGPNEIWGAMAVKHLLKIEFFSEALDDAVEACLRQVSELANSAAKFYSITWPPEKPDSSLAAYAIAQAYKGDPDSNKNLDESREFARKVICQKVGDDRVGWRNETAFAAAALLRIGTDADVSNSLAVANAILADLNPEGRLYSTYDSVAAIVLLSELSQQIENSDSPVVINDRHVTRCEAAELADEVRSITSQSETLSLELVRLSMSSWDAYDGRVPIRVSMSCGGSNQDRFVCGDTVTLRIDIKEGYQPGDLVWIALPPCLARIENGGQVKQFSIDPQGESHVEIRIAAIEASYHESTFKSEAESPKASLQQHFCVSVRNMFFEERVGNPGPIPIRIDPILHQV